MPLYLKIVVRNLWCHGSYIITHQSLTPKKSVWGFLFAWRLTAAVLRNLRRGRRVNHILLLSGQQIIEAHLRLLHPSLQQWRESH